MNKTTASSTPEFTVRTPFSAREEKKSVVSVAQRDGKINVVVTRPDAGGNWKNDVHVSVNFSMEEAQSLLKSLLAAMEGK